MAIQPTLCRNSCGRIQGPTQAETISTEMQRHFGPIRAVALDTDLQISFFPSETIQHGTRPETFSRSEKAMQPKRINCHLHPCRNTGKLEQTLTDHTADFSSDPSRI